VQFLLECGLRSLDCDFVIGFITIWKPEVKVFDVQVHEREDKLQEINIPATSVRGKSKDVISKNNSTGSSI